MADCELCTRARPLLFPIKAPVHNLTYPEGAYKGVCDICLDHLEKGWQERFGPKPEARNKIITILSYAKILKPFLE